MGCWAFGEVGGGVINERFANLKPMGGWLNLWTCDCIQPANGHF